MKRIPEIDKLKDRIKALPHADAERLADWLQGVTSVRREDKKREEKRINKPQPQQLNIERQAS